MKYYLVNYILLDKKVITENENVGIGLRTYADINEFKKSIVTLKHAEIETEKVIIKSYKQISQEAFNCLDTRVV